MFFTIFWAFFTFGKIGALVNVELVFQLQESLKSDVVLVAKDENQNGKKKFNFSILSFPQKIFFVDEFVKRFYTFKKAQKIFTSTIDIYKDFGKHFEKNFLSPYQNTMIIAHENFNLSKIFKNTESVAMASIIWIKFVQNITKENFKDLDILYNCRFFLIHKINDHNYEIQDVYQIGPSTPKIFSYFGFWNGENLDIFKGDFFSRRMDLNGHQMNVYITYVSQIIYN